MRVGLDVHGVIDKYPKFFSILSDTLIKIGHEVHIITGQEISDKLVKKLKKFNIGYTTIHSITDYNKSKGTQIKYQDPNNPWMDDDTWNSTKAKICKEYNIDFIFDDSDLYGKWFKKLKVKTKYIHIKND